MIIISFRIRETTQNMLRTEMTTVLRELFAAQKNDINTLVLQHLRQQQTATPKLPAPTPTNISRTTTPLPATVAVPIVSSASAATTTGDVKQQHVVKLIRTGQYNQAFEFVLSASDLNLVLYLCEHIPPTELFSMKPFPLQTPVLLSLIQQLAANLTTHQELKLRSKSFRFSVLVEFSLFSVI